MEGDFDRVVGRPANFLSLALISFLSLNLFSGIFSAFVGHSDARMMAFAALGVGFLVFFASSKLSLFKSRAFAAVAVYVALVMLLMRFFAQFSDSCPKSFPLGDSDLTYLSVFAEFVCFSCGGDRRKGTRAAVCGTIYLTLLFGCLLFAAGIVSGALSCMIFSLICSFFWDKRNFPRVLSAEAFALSALFVVVFSSGRLTALFAGRISSAIANGPSGSLSAAIGSFGVSGIVFFAFVIFALSVMNVRNGLGCSFCFFTGITFLLSVLPDSAPGLVRVPDFMKFDFYLLNGSVATVMIDALFLGLISRGANG